ncbi:hypothetical protein J437_LFUL003708 [Ladona fulva]|uniref:Uncharacterized protein n=1 Tax=Ladona fulva TaxID=123851 RepID=A0A8K0NVT6_LADFU|nr:hypothetical protein J437_LFUL003708 [Ladona fulva]
MTRIENLFVSDRRDLKDLALIPNCATDEKSKLAGNESVSASYYSDGLLFTSNNDFGTPLSGRDNRPRKELRAHCLRTFIIRTKDSVFCFSCYSFGTTTTRGQLANEGCCDWRHIGDKLQQHEDSVRDSMVGISSEVVQW